MVLARTAQTMTILIALVRPLLYVCFCTSRCTARVPAIADIRRSQSDFPSHRTSISRNAIVKLTSMIDFNPSNAGSSDAGPRAAVRPFVLMLICSAVIVIGLLVIKITTSFPGIQYTHLLVNYDFGVIKRALVGAVVSLFRPKVGLVDVYVVGLTAWLVTLIAYLAVFRRHVRPFRAYVPPLAIILFSPVFFKNFMFSIGYFDVLGCLLALIVLLLPVNLRCR